MRYEVRECTAADCGLRYPQPAGALPGDECPRCRGRSEQRHVLDVIDRETTPGVRRGAALFDNVRSAFNVGSMLRTADGVGLAHVYLCGTTAVASSAKVAKTSLGAERAVPTSHHRNAVRLGEALRGAGRRLWALEVSDRAVPLFEAPPLDDDVVLIAGNELVGVDPDLLAQCEAVISIPTFGSKRSFNVAVAFGIAATVLTRDQGDRRRRL